MNIIKSAKLLFSTIQKIDHRQGNRQHLPKIYSEITLDKAYLHTSNQNYIKDLKKQSEVIHFRLIEQRLNNFYSYIKSDIVDTNQQSIKQISHYYFSKAGKLLRPIMLFLLNDAVAAKRQCDPKDNLIKKWAAIVEILHIASLAHDDVIDDSPLRRGLQSQHLKFGKKISIFGANFAVGKAMEKIGDLQNMSYYQLSAKIMQDLVEGQIIQSLKIRQFDNLHLMMDTYMDKTYFKTAALISNMLRAVSHLHNLGVEQQLKFFKAGQHLGLSFQLIDDLLDYVGDSEQMGKQNLSDLVEGNITAPVLFTLLSFRTDKKFKVLTQILKQRKIKKQNVLIINQMIKQTNSFQLTKRLAILHVCEALQQIQQCKFAEPYIQTYRHLAVLILSRNK